MKRTKFQVRATKILSCTGKKIMRCCCLLTAALFVTSCANTTKNATGEFHGVCFNTENVITEFEVGETTHYVIYDDMDCGLDNAIIRLDPKTYYAVMTAIQNGK